MRRVGFEEYKAASGISDELIKRLRKRTQLALAFGRGEAYQSLGYIELDAVATVLTTFLNARGIDRKTAAQIVRIHWPIWTRAVAMVEAGYRKKDAPPIFFAVIEFINGDGKPAHVAAAGTIAEADAIAAEALKIAKGARPIGSMAVSVTDVLFTVRQNAAKANFDWLDKFVWPLGDPRLEKICQDGKEALARAVREVRSQRGKEDLSRRAGIMARALMEADLPHDEEAI